MQKHLTVSVPSPCYENWNEFAPVNGGRFCRSCQKVVVDFTTMTDEEVINYFNNANGKTCGRLRNDQLKTYTHFNYAKPSRLKLFKAGLAGLFFMALTKPAHAQVKQTPQIQLSTEESTLADSVIAAEALKVRGVVKSAEDRTGLPGVNVVLKGTPYGTVTDSNGEFIFPQELIEGDVLVFSFIGLETVELRINKKLAGSLEIPMVCMNYDLTGEIVVDGLYTERPSVFKRAWRGLKNLF